MALTRVGQQPVNSIDDTTDDTAQLGKRLYKDTVKEVLRSHEWNCCKTRAVLTQNTTGPDFGWTYSYTLPTECLNLISVNGYSSDTGYVEDLYEVEGRDVLTDADECKITYVQYTDNTTLFDALLTECIILLLASKLASRVGRNPGLSNALLQEYEQVKLKNAKRADGRERNKRKYNLADRSKWIEARTTYRP